MAGLLDVITATQKPRVHQYIRDLLDRAEVLHGQDSSAYRGIYNQYFRMPATEVGAAQSTRHYDALGDNLPNGIERLYRRVVVIGMLSACSSECVFCIKGLYDPHTLNDAEISDVIDYLACDEYLTEVLITGGDPLIAPKRFGALVSRIAESVPNIRLVRVGTRLPVQNPLTFRDDTYDIFRRYSDRFLFEIGIQINHPFELQPEAVDAIDRLTDCGVRFYSQNALLKGVNDDIDTLIDLYDQLRSLKIIPHYLFHAVPIVGTDEFRTSVARGLELARQLTTSGYVSGMSKPTFALMTDIGKITLYEGSILSKRDGILTVRTSYRLEDRLRWNPGYRLPESATVNELGTLDVEYVDGED
jgi:lysine 2,3-aminomutase